MKEANLVRDTVKAYGEGGSMGGEGCVGKIG